MKTSLFSSQWYRVAEIKPRLKNHAGIHRHHYRGQVWYVLEDKIGGRFHRFTEGAYAVINLMDGQRSLQTIWELTVSQFGADAPSQDDVIHLLGQLHGADALASDVAPDLMEVFGRHSQHQAQQWKQRWMNPLSIRFGLLDPDALLNRSNRWVAPLFSIWGGLVWLALVGFALALTVFHWKALTQDVADTVLTPQNLIIMALVFPLLKAWHEFGHASAVKAWGGDVHEMGIMLLVFMPVPYVDASASTMFRERHRRAIVGAAGVMAELMIAALAMIYWVHSEGGLLRTICYNVIFIAGVSAVLFNINPLLRFDGYYIFSDLLEIPNLAQRANRYLIYVLQRYVLRIKTASTPVTATGERGWFLVYGLAAFAYRCFISITIAVFVASKFFIAGVALAIWSLAAMFVAPLIKGGWFVLGDASLHSRRGRVVGAGVILLSALAYVVLALPLPYWTNAEGVIWLPDQALVRAGTDCFVTRFMVEPGRQVEPGQALIACDDPLLKANVSKSKSEFDEASVRYVDALSKSAAQASLVLDELNALRARWRDLEARSSQLTIRSRTHGTFLVPHERDLPGQFAEQGRILAYVVGSDKVNVRLAVEQGQAALVGDDGADIEMIRSSRTDEVLHGKLGRALPGADNTLPSAALGSTAGGNIAVDPRDGKGTKAFTKVFQFDVALPASTMVSVYGERVFVRVHHHDEVLSVRWYRSVRRLFADRFGV